MFRFALATLFVVSTLQAQTVLDAFISTGDNHWLGSSLPVDSPRSIEDTFEFLHKVCNVKRVYWRGLEEATWIQTMEERPENCRYYSFWQWIRRVYRDVDPDRVAAQAAHKRGMEIWGVGTMFDWGAEADTPGFGDYPANSESRLRLQHPEWAPVDRHGFRKQGGPIELAYPEARKALVDLHAREAKRVGYDGVLFLTYLENYSLRFQDEFGFSGPVVEAFQKRVRRDLLKDPFTRTASREDWLRGRGGFITDYLRELKAELTKDKRQLGVFVDPHDLHLPQPWNVPEMMRTAGSHYMDLETWVREGIVDLLPVYGYCAPQLQDAGVQDCRWLTRNSATQVSAITSSPMVEKWAALRAEGVRTIMSVNEDAHFAARGPVPEQTAEALASGDLARVCKALSQVIDGKLPAVPAALIPLAKEGNLVQRRLALQALALTKDAQALAVIEASLNDPENGIRCMAAQVLRGFNGPGSGEALLAAVAKFGNHPLRETAATTLMGMKPFPRELLHKTMAESKNVHVRIVAMRALSVVAGGADVPALLQGLAGPERYPRFLAVTGLGNVRKDEGAVQALIRTLGHFDAVLANRAAASLAEMARRNEPALKPHRADALAKLTLRHGLYTSGYTGIDSDWGYRTVGNALLDFGPEGRAVMEKALANKTDLHQARLAFRVLRLPQRPNSFSEVTQAENDAVFAHLPAAPPAHVPVTLTVDPAGEIKTMADAVRRARAGDTIRLTPGTYKESLVFNDRRGEHGKPITVEGQGAILDGGDDQDLASWENLGGDLYRKAKLLRMDDGVLMRWFMLFDGKMQRMGRCSKGPTLALKKPEDLQLNEWTFVAADDALYIRVKPGTRVTAPVRSSGVAISGTCRHLIIRNVVATHVYNDGYNIHGWCRDVVFENIKAIECGDDGVSAHDDCEIRVNGLVSQGNATGITDVGESVSHYKNVTIGDCDGFDLFFIGSNAHSVTNGVIHSRAARTLTLDGSRENAALCTLRLENVKLLREGTPNEMRVTANSRLDMEKVECVNLLVQVTGGEISANHCTFTGTPKQEIHLWPGTKWSGDHNVFGVTGIRFGDAWYYAKDAKAFAEVFGSDAGSRWE
ncbi:MAG: hypothetical protein U0984_13735 [Prosthecobacter sp.]|nr:hypothetical protein [Prosthecobacter sp.]